MRSLNNPAPYAVAPARRKNRESVAPTIMNGTVVAPGVSSAVTRLIESHSGVSIGDALASSSLWAWMSTEPARSPSASASMSLISAAR